MLHDWPNVCESVLHQVQLLIERSTYIHTQIHQGRQSNESSSWGDGACEGQIDIKIAQVTKLPIWEIRADYIFLSYSAHFSVFCYTESFLLIPWTLSVASWWERPKRLRVVSRVSVLLIVLVFLHRSRGPISSLRWEKLHCVMMLHELSRWAACTSILS